MTKSILLERIDLMYYDKNKSAIVLFEKVRFNSGKVVEKLTIYEDVGIGINDILDNYDEDLIDKTNKNVQLYDLRFVQFDKLFEFLKY